jgi:hypothetical protein
VGGYGGVNDLEDFGGLGCLSLQESQPILETDLDYLGRAFCFHLTHRSHLTFFSIRLSNRFAAKSKEKRRENSKVGNALNAQRLTRQVHCSAWSGWLAEGIIADYFGHLKKNFGKIQRSFFAAKTQHTPPMWLLVKEG